MRNYFVVGVRFFLIIAFNVVFLCYGNRMEGSEATKVALVPFSMNADEDLEYISRAVRDMLASRISSGTQISVITQSVVREALAKKMYSGKLAYKEALGVGTALGVEYVLFGSITKSGNNLSIDVNVLNVLKAEVESVISQNVGVEEVIPKMRDLAQGIRDTIVAGVEKRSPAVVVPIIQTDPGGTVLEKKSKLQEIDLPERSGEIEIPESTVEQVPSAEESEQDTLNKQEITPEESEQNTGSTRKRYDTFSENPVYQKSVEEIDKPTSPAEKTSLPSEGNNSSLGAKQNEKGSNKKRKFDLPSENPAYQKSVEELGETPSSSVPTKNLGSEKNDLDKKGEIDALSENPVYQKTLGELNDHSVSGKE
jgi:TolB-like protein